MSSVRVRSPDWNLVFSRLEAWARALVDSDPRVLGVLLYGSLARGNHAPGSDADLLIVVDRSPFPARFRAQHLPRLRLPVCHEELVYTEDEMRQLGADGNHFLHRALREGRWLACRQSWHPDVPKPIAAAHQGGITPARSSGAADRGR